MFGLWTLKEYTEWEELSEIPAGRWSRKSESADLSDLQHLFAELHPKAAIIDVSVTVFLLLDELCVEVTEGTKRITQMSQDIWHQI